MKWMRGKSINFYEYDVVMVTKMSLYNEIRIINVDIYVYDEIIRAISANYEM